MPTPNTTYQCKKCGMCFSTNGSLRDHSRTHREKRIECLEPGCSKMFTTREHLRKHLNITHNEIKLKCNICYKAYGSSSALKRHERSHQEEKRFNCDQCGAGFDLSEPFKIHMRTHEGICPYICSHCGKTFASRGICRRHAKKVHSSDKPVEMLSGKSK